MNGILHDQKAFRTKRLRTKIIQIITAVFLLAGIWLPASAATVMIVGDSLSDAYGLPRQSGWVHQLTERWDGRHEVVNASISGETTAGALSRIEALLERHRPDLMVVILGGNDGLRGLAPNQTEDNLAALIEKGKAADARVALMQIRMPANMGPGYIQRFESVFPRLAESLNVQLLPFFLDGIFDRPGMLQADGIHPTAEAQSLMLEATLPALAVLCEEPSRDYVLPAGLNLAVSLLVLVRSLQWSPCPNAKSWNTMWSSSVPARPGWRVPSVSSSCQPTSASASLKNRPKSAAISCRVRL